MPRWLVAFVLSLVLSCYGVSALAHNSVVAAVDKGAAPAAVALATLSAPLDATDGVTDGVFSAADFGLGDEPGETVPASTDVASEGAEAVDRHRPAVPVPLIVARPTREIASAPWPVLERPKRPPRLAAIAG